VFGVTRITADLIESVYFDLTYTFDFFPFSLCANYVNILRNDFTTCKINFHFLAFLSYTKTSGVLEGFILGP
jgi:hypothetical protein